ncbi:hypothetical protein BV25DRAFT_1920092 [Artomyces pyxidatus]|uniref:Uncharacterized protein n=1 Tax=Artomyces pyxidatus TaxID=48021 RepID=A0ACB8SMN4_9AGAM|nr:hypothetical protein BV25DRAFT_1920092 [Artomyces pyxidatus]
MAFFQNTSGTELVRDQWPGSVARTAADELAYQQLTHQHVVPCTYEDMCEWAYVWHDARSHNFSRQFRLLHHPTPTYDQMNLRHVEITFRFQGFLGKHNLKTLGNWNGNPERAYRASQSIELHGGHFPEVFSAQFHAFEHVKTLVHRALLSEDELFHMLSDIGDNTEQRIAFDRRVFTKVFNPATIVDQWRITEKLALGRRLADGTIERCNQFIFARGDFVDVAAAVDIANVKTYRGIPGVSIQLCPRHVVQLCKAADVPTILNVPADIALDAVAEPSIESTGLLF